MIAVLERFAWALGRLVFEVETVQGVRFMDVRNRPTPDQVSATLHNAVETLRIAGAEFLQLVTQELALIGATRETKERVSVALRAYLSPFTGHERWNSQLLAARLVWAATYLREYRLAKERRARFDKDGAASLAMDAQLAFVARLPNADRWVDFLKG